MKVVILGGGPAGCTVAYFLKKSGFDDITLIEEDEIGGCVKTRFYQGIPYEYGPQIMYTDEARLKAVFEEFLEQHEPPSSDGKYHPTLSIDGKLDGNSVHDFPVNIQNVLKLPNPEEVIFELYHVNLEKPDYSNFENYAVSRLGRTLYEQYVKNYNVKQWKIHPMDMDAEWARFRNLTLKAKSEGMFGDKWQGHPGDFNPMWTAMTEGIKIVKGRASLSNDSRSVEIDGERINSDLVICTIPLSPELEFINVTKVYVAVKSEQFVLPTYVTSFPNNFNFTRIMDYKQQFFVESEYSLLDFAFPWKNEFDVDKYVEEALWYVSNTLKKEVVEYWPSTRKNVYPLSTKKNLDLLGHTLDGIADKPVIPMGRQGMYAYISKDTCIRMGFIMSENMEALTNGRPEDKKMVFAKMREKLT